MNNTDSPRRPALVRGRMAAAVLAVIGSALLAAPAAGSPVPSTAGLGQVQCGSPMAG
jgi:hypothetical protein